MKLLSILFFLIFVSTIGFSQNEKLYNSFNHLKATQTYSEIAQYKILKPEWYLDSTYFFSYKNSNWNLHTKIVTGADDERGNDLEQTKFTIGADSVWLNNTISNFTYHENDVLNTSLRRKWENGSWGDTSVYVLQNDKGNRLELFLNINPPRQTLSKYNDNDQLIDESEYRRLSSLEWDNFSRKTYTYNSDDLLSHFLFENYKDDEFINFEYDTMIYENEKLLNQKRYTWSVNNQWIPKYNVIFTQENGNNITTIQSWNGQEWVNLSKKDVLYDGNLLHGTEDFVWSDNDWVKSKRFTYLYNDVEWIVGTLSENWNVANASYDNFLSNTYDRFEQNKTASQITRIWDKQNNQWKKLTMAILYWTEKDFHVDTKTTIKDDKYQLYPNPSSSIINIKGANTNLSSKIYSIDGKWMMSTHRNRIDISGLAKGSYILKTDDGFVGKFVVE